MVMGFRESFKKAFAIVNADGSAISEVDLELITEMAQVVVKRGLATPAIFFLESVKPLSFLSSQLMAFFGPLVTMLFNKEKYDRLQMIFENRESANVLIDKIQEADLAQPKKSSKRSKK